MLREQRSPVAPCYGGDHAVHHAARSKSNGAAASVNARRCIEVRGGIEVRSSVKRRRSRFLTQTFRPFRNWNVFADGSLLQAASPP